MRIYFCKNSEELWCVKVKLLHISKSSIFQKAGFIWFAKRIYYIFGFKKHFLYWESANKRTLSSVGLKVIFKPYRE